MTQPLLTMLLVIFISYALGCFSTAYYLVRWRTGQDIREVGSGTAGARNVGRVLGKGGFALTFLGDALKGALAVAIAYWFALPSAGVVAALLVVVAGHLWPIQLGGKGGKGASTALGGVLVIDPWLGLGVLALAGIFLGITRSFSRAGMIAMALAPIVAWLLGLEVVFVLGILVLILLLLFAHRDNWMAKRVAASLKPNAEQSNVENPTTVEQ